MDLDAAKQSQKKGLIEIICSASVGDALMR